MGTYDPGKWSTAMIKGDPEKQGYGLHAPFVKDLES